MFWRVIARMARLCGLQRETLILNWAFLRNWFSAYKSKCMCVFVERTVRNVLDHCSMETWSLLLLVTYHYSLLFLSFNFFLLIPLPCLTLLFMIVTCRLFASICHDLSFPRDRFIYAIVMSHAPFSIFYYVLSFLMYWKVQLSNFKYGIMTIIYRSFVFASVYQWHFGHLLLTNALYNVIFDPNDV